MSEDRTHRAIGTIVGGACGIAKAQQQRPENIQFDVVGGVVAGSPAIRRTEVFDPLLRPGVAHGFVPAATAGIALDAFTRAGLSLLA